MQETITKGLTSLEAAENLKKFGRNQLVGKKKQSVVKLFLEQFKDIMVLILLGATIISVAMGEIYDAVTIIIIVLLDAILGFFQEYRTERTMEALEKLTAPTANVIRDGEKTKIDASLIVPDDIVLIEAGDRVPCDGAIINENGLWCDESILTGESEAVRKKVGHVYMGTSVTRGNAVIRCTETGMITKMGQMSALISEAGKDQTPLQKKLGSLGRVLCVICLLVCAVVAIAGMLRGEPIFDMLMTGITIAIAAIPEGLPATVTISLALAVRRMLKKNALVHKLHSVETLGCTTVICTDKTGTLTENKMTVTKLYTVDSEFDVSGSGQSVSGEVRNASSGVKLNSGNITYPLKQLITCGVLCNDASITINDSQCTLDGDPTEAALLVAAEKAGLHIDDIKSRARRLRETPFESETKRMSVTVSTPSGELTYTKGAPDVIIRECRRILTSSGTEIFTNQLKKAVTDAYESYARKALRVMAFSMSDPSGEKVFIGLMGMIDAPRKEAKKSVAELRKAGIRTVMITGDHKLTAEAIAKEIGILRPGGISVSKDELDLMSDEELDRVITRACVFSRVDPKDKLRIVSALKGRGNIVAMTGDGVNDAPAVKEANIGIAMGKTGTEACRQAADIILLDDDFSTICNAVKEGRSIYSNIRKFVMYLISCNLGEVAVMFLSIVLGMPVILLPTQILLVNLVTDGLPAIALGMERTEKNVLDRSPKEFSGSFFSNGLLTRIIIRGALIGICTLACFAYSLYMGLSIEAARTCALVTLISSQLIHVFECRSEHESVFKMNPFGNMWLIGAVAVSAAATALCVYLPTLSIVMETVPLLMTELAWSMVFAAAVPIVSGILMLFFKK